MTTNSDPPARPRLMSGIRKFGRYENFQQFDNLSSGIASVGSKSFGKITVDCRLLFTKSQWGILGEKDFPAGIMYLDLNFGPPSGCRIKSATVTVTLDDEHPSLRPYKTDRKLHDSGCPVQITDWYGPKQLSGQMKSAEVKRLRKLTPEVNVLGNGAGGLGVESEKAFTRAARWSFNGQLLAGKGTWTYKSLRWDLSENELETQSFRSPEVHTAFTFAHAGQPFLMTVEIAGKLEKWNDRVKSKIKFGSGSEKDGKVATLIDFVEYKKFQHRLDKVARGLQRDMELKNFEEIPVEIPDSVPPTNIWQSSAQSMTQATATAPYQTWRTHPQSSTLTNNTSEHPLLEPSGQTQEAPRHQRHRAANEGKPLTIENVQRLLVALGRSELVEHNEDKQDLSSNSGRTLVEAEDGTGNMENSQTHHTSEDQSITVRSAVDQETIINVLKIPGILTLLQLLAGLVNLLGSSGSQKAEQKGSTTATRPEGYSNDISSKAENSTINRHAQVEDEPLQVSG